MSHAAAISEFIDQYIEEHTTKATAPLREQLERAARSHAITRGELEAALARIAELENTPAPDAWSDDVGVPRGTKLQRYTGPAAITTDGATFRNTWFPGKIDVRADGVEFEACRGTNPTDALVMCGSKAKNVTLRRCTLRPSGTSSNTIGVVGHDFTLDRVDISGTIDGVRIHNTSDRTAPANVAIHGSRIHDLCWIHDGHAGKETHNDCIQIESGNGNINILDTLLSAYGDPELGNIIDNPRGPHVYSGIMITPNVGPVSGVLVDGVTFEGGYTHINIDEKGRGPIRGLVVRNARFKGDTTTGKDLLMPATTRAAIDFDTWIGNTRTATREPVRL